MHGTSFNVLCHPLIMITVWSREEMEGDIKMEVTLVRTYGFGSLPGWLVQVLHVYMSISQQPMHSSIFSTNWMKVQDGICAEGVSPLPLYFSSSRLNWSSPKGAPSKTELSLTFFFSLPLRLPLFVFLLSFSQVLSWFTPSEALCSLSRKHSPTSLCFPAPPPLWDLLLL